MELYHENYAKQLERLLEIVNDGKEGYKTAAEHVHSEELKGLFLKFSSERAEMADEIKQKISSIGGSTENKKGDQAGYFHRTMMALKTAFTKADKDDQAVLESCRTEDQAALDTIDDILQGSILETNLKGYLTKWRYPISMAFNEIDRRYFERFKTSPEI